LAAAPGGRSSRIRFRRRRESDGPSARRALLAGGFHRAVSAEWRGRESPELPSRVWSGSGLGTRVDGMERVAVKGLRVKDPRRRKGAGAGERAAAARAPTALGRLRLAQPAYLCRSWRPFHGRDWHRDATCVIRPRRRLILEIARCRAHSGMEEIEGRTKGASQRRAVDAIEGRGSLDRAHTTQRLVGAERLEACTRTAGVARRRFPSSSNTSAVLEALRSSIRHRLANALLTRGGET
jgi:hypothetical protein